MCSFLIGREFEDSFASISHYVRENINCPHQIWQRFVRSKMAVSIEKS